MRQVFRRVQGNDFSLHAPVYLRISSDFYLKLPQFGTRIFYHTTPDFTTGNVSRETFSAFLHDRGTPNR